MSAPAPTTVAGNPSSATMRRVVAASFVGNLVEWFDYAVYGYLATTLATVFFPETSQTAALLSTFAVFAVSFIVRPLGGIFWGRFGDRNGRRAALSISIIIMSCSTVVVAILPSYDQVGLLAPLLLLVVRLAQGFSAAGEYAGAAAFLYEYAPTRRRGLYTSVVPASTAAGLLVGSVSATLLTSLLSSAEMSSWGWRIPFLLAAPLGLLGRYVRLRLEDTPEFLELEEQDSESHTPIKETFTHNRGQILRALGATCLNAVGFYMLLTYMPTYLSNEVGLSETAAFTSTTVSLLIYIVAVFGAGRMSDTYGRPRMLITTGALFAVLSIPLFLLLGVAGLTGIFLIQIGLGLMLTGNDGCLPAYLADLFPTRVRYSGFAFSFNTANALFGGTAPFIATLLINLTDNPVSPAWYLVAAGLVALVAVAITQAGSRKAVHAG